MLSIPFQTGEQFWKLPECYIRGSTVRTSGLAPRLHSVILTRPSLSRSLSQVKYCRVADALVDTVKEAEEEARKQRQAQGSLSGGVGLGMRGGRGGGGAGRGGPGQNNRGGQRGGGQRGGRGRGQQH